jgi:hypothetical protein
MQLYSGTTGSLIEDSTKNRIAAKLSDSFFYHFCFSATRFGSQFVEELPQGHMSGIPIGGIAEQWRGFGTAAPSYVQEIGLPCHRTGQAEGKRRHCRVETMG